MEELMDIKLETEELEAIRLILSKKITAENAMNRTDFQESMTDKLISLYFKAAQENLAEAKYSETRWWEMMTKKYDLPDASLDVNTGRIVKIIKQTE